MLRLGSDDNGIRSHKYTKVSSMDHNGLELGIGIKDLKKLEMAETRICATDFH